jgi:hypothetical protein
MRESASASRIESASALFRKVEVEGYQRMRYELTPDAIDLGLDAALPAELVVGAQMGGVWRGREDLAPQNLPHRARPTTRSS